MTSPTPLRSVLFAALVAWVASATAACQSKAPSEPSQNPAAAAKPASDKPAEPNAPGASGAPKDRAAVEKVAPSIDFKTQPPDVIKLPSGITYKKLSSADGPMPTRNDTVLIHVTGWKIATGETFTTTRTRNAPIPLDLSMAGSNFADVFSQLHKGEKAMVWMPPELAAQKGQGVAEALAFEVELVEIQPAPPVPADVAGPPANAQKTKGGLRYVTLEPGKGEKARFFDTAQFRFTIWDSTGKLIASTEKRSRPVSSALYRQPAPLEDMMTAMSAGQRVRFWVDATKMEQPAAQGQLCYELTVTEITKATHAPPPTPRDVKAPPPGVKKTESGVFYRVLKAAPAPKAGAPAPAKPTGTDTVKVHYTGWTTDGRMFDSSVVRGEPTSFPLTGVIKGWTDGIPMLSVGESARFWIPEELAYQGKPNNPKGMLVFDVELLEILPPSPAGGLGGMGGMGGNPHGSPHGAAGGAPDAHSDHDGHGH